jgi:hypothetical protein
LVTIDVRSQDDKDYEESLTNAKKDKETNGELKAFCEECRDETGYVVSDFCKKKDIKNHTVKFVSRLAKCSVCGKDVFVAEIRDYNLKQLNKKLEDAEKGEF